MAQPDESAGTVAAKRTVCVRRARLSDYQGVLDINKAVYSGMDYVPLNYQAMINDPDLTFFVVEVDGEVVAFEGAILADDGRAIQMRSTRVKDSHQGQGYAKLMAEHVEDHYRQAASPPPRAIRTVQTNLVRFMHSDRFRRENRLILTRDHLGFRNNHARMEVTLDPVDDHRLAMPMTIGQLARLLERDDLKSLLFRGGVFTTRYYVFEAIRSNASHLERLGAYVVATKNILQRLEQPEKGSDVIQSQDAALTSGADQETGSVLAMACHYFTPKLLVYTVDVYGPPEVDAYSPEIVESLMKHFIANIQGVLKGRSPQVEVSFCVFIPEDGPSKVFRDVIMTSFPFFTTESWGGIERIYCFERPFPSRKDL